MALSRNHSNYDIVLSLVEYGKLSAMFYNGLLD